MHRQPAEISIDDAKRYVDGLRAQATQEEQTLAAKAEELRQLGEMGRQYGEETPRIDIYALRRAIRNEKGKRFNLTDAEKRVVEYDRLKGLIPALRQQAKTIETHVFPAFGGELVKVLV